MKPLQTSPSNKKSGLTLIEITLVIVILLGIIGIGMTYMGGSEDWEKGKEASEALREVYTAQKHYLADNPTTNVTDIEASDLVPYLRNGLTAIPTVESIDGGSLSIKVDVTPPVIDDGSSGTYDPSGATDDGLWDVGF